VGTRRYPSGLWHGRSETHAKLLLVIRREREKNGDAELRYYAHLGTGNYHQSITKLYNEFGLLTSDQKLVTEVNEVFMLLTSLTKLKKMDLLCLAGFSPQKEIINTIHNEAEIARKGWLARIIAKMSVLLD